MDTFDTIASISLEIYRLEDTTGYHETSNYICNVFIIDITKIDDTHYEWCKTKY